MMTVVIIAYLWCGERRCFTLRRARKARGSLGLGVMVMGETWREIRYHAWAE